MEHKEIEDKVRNFLIDKLDIDVEEIIPDFRIIYHIGIDRFAMEVIVLTKDGVFGFKSQI